MMKKTLVSVKANTEKCSFSVLPKEESEKVLTSMGLDVESYTCIKINEDDKIYVLPLSKELPVKFIHSRPKVTVSYSMDNLKLTASLKDTVKDIIYDSTKNEWYLCTNHIGDFLLSEDEAHRLLRELDKSEG